MIPHKTCSRCATSKPLNEFHKRADQRDGHAAICKACQSAYDRDPERMAKKNERLKQKYAENPEFREERKAYVRQHYAENEEYNQSTKDRVAIWQRENKEQVNENARQRYESYYAPTDRARKTKRRELLAASPERFTQQQWKDLCGHYGNHCLRCNQVKPLTVDHIVPLLLGGTDGIDNIQPLCGPCNTSKGQATTDYRPDQGDRY